MTDKTKGESLLSACEKKETKLAVSLIKDPNTSIYETDPYCCTALHLASGSNREVPIVKALLGRIDLAPNLLTNGQSPPLLWASQNGNISIMHLLASDPRVVVDAELLKKACSFHNEKGLEGVKMLLSTDKNLVVSFGITSFRDDVVMLIEEYMRNPEEQVKILREEMEIEGKNFFLLSNNLFCSTLFFFLSPPPHPNVNESNSAHENNEKKHGLKNFFKSIPLHCGLLGNQKQPHNPKKLPT